MFPCGLGKSANKKCPPSDLFGKPCQILFELRRQIANGLKAGETHYPNYNSACIYLVIKVEFSELN